MCLTEERIRRIVGEEVAKILDAAREKADLPEHIDTLRLEDSLIVIFKTNSKEEAEKKMGELKDRPKGQIQETGLG